MLIKNLFFFSLYGFNIFLVNVLKLLVWILIMFFGDLFRRKVLDEIIESKVIKVFCFYFKVKLKFIKMLLSVFLKSYFFIRCDNKSYCIK